MTHAWEVIQLRKAVRELLRCSYEARCMEEKDPEQYDEYDTMMAPLWQAVREAYEST